MIWGLLVDLGEWESDDVGRVVLLALHRGASPGTVVTCKDLQVPKDRVGELDASVPPLTGEEFLPASDPEGLGDGVVVGVADGARRGQRPGFLGALGERP
jgi:hypothetical protein